MNIKETLYSILLVGVSGTALFQLVSAPIGKKENIFDLLNSNAYAGEATKEENLEQKTEAVPFMELYHKTNPEALKHYMNAVRAYGKWLKNKPKDTIVEQWLELNNEKIDESAINECKEAIRIDSKSPLLYWQLAQLYEVNGKINLAIENAEKALTLEKRFSQNYPLLGRLYKSEGRYEEAREIYKKFLELEPNCKYKKLIEMHIKECEIKLETK